MNDKSPNSNREKVSSDAIAITILYPKHHYSFDATIFSIIDHGTHMGTPQI